MSLTAQHSIKSSLLKHLPIMPDSVMALNDHAILASTGLLYPSNSTVQIVIEKKFEDHFLVHDNGGAFSIAMDHNRFITARHQGFKHIIEEQGLSFENQSIMAPPVKAETLRSALMFVANASRDAAFWALENIKAEIKSMPDLSEVFVDHFGKKRVKKNHRVSGESSRQYTFDIMLELSNDNKAFFNQTSNDANSINANVVACVDIKKLHNKKLIPHLVYDDGEQWKSSTLNSLKVLAEVPVYARSKAENWIKAFDKSAA